MTFQYLNKDLNIKSVSLDDLYISPDVIKLIPKETVKKYGIMPFKIIKNKLLIAMVNTSDETVKEEIRFITGMEVIPYVDTKYNIFSAIESYYEKQTVNEVLEDLKNVNYIVKDDENNNKIIENAPVVKLTNSIINQAINLKASDIHLEPFKDNVKVRFRIDGVLNEILTIPREVYMLVSTRIKIKSSMDISKKMIPQDGKMEYKFKDNVLDLRTSTLPIVNGEKIVIRILYKFNNDIQLEDLIQDNEDLNLIKDILKHPNGIVLVTGPTGSGKTTTLCAMLNYLNSKEKNIITVEDPVEYQIYGINQMNVNNKAGLTFSTALRSILRQDPDIIMVGEIRDSETANISIKAAITGHLVLATLHTKDAASAAIRLSDMNVSDYLIADSLVAVIAQRLVRKICPYCKEEYITNNKERKLLNLHDNMKIYKGRGCKFCNGSGYKGRRAIFEIMYLDDIHRELLRKKEVSKKIKEYSIKNGMVDIRNKHRELVLKGITTIEEMMRNSYGYI
ncbi:GspE/PulE family protein [Clostridium botulinum]|uniref:GspE/PulE family protein n=1 Tax=Clostridium botulinum TaxID=1491 RepID=UPI000B33155E|nr:GspE/PulE family protein [Clostridium botulinum]